jgi:hypothetical protein
MARICPTALIGKFVDQLAVREVFCSKDLLPFAERSQIDNVLSRMTKKRIIIRLARGIYCRKDHKDPELPSMLEIISAKARVFKRRLGKASKKLKAKAKTLYQRLKEKTNRTLVLFTTSATSSMQTIYGRVYYQQASARWLEPDTTSSGITIKKFITALLGQSNIFTRSGLQALVKENFAFSGVKL